MKKKLLTVLTISLLLMCVFVFASCDLFNSSDTGKDDNGGGGGGGNNPQYYKTSGTYEVGVDIDAAEYLLVKDGITAYLEVKTSRTAAVTSPEFLYNASFSNRRYISVNAGEFLTFSGAKLYKLESTPAIDKTDKGYVAGQYKVGRDLPIGEYVVVDTSKSTLNYLEQLKSPNAKPTSSDFLFNKLFSYRQYVNLESGQYISFSYGKLYPIADSPAAVGAEGLYPSGQYKIGADLPAGNYTLKVDPGKSGYYEITTLPLCSVMSTGFVKNGTINTDTTITLVDGQYIHISRASIIAA